MNRYLKCSHIRHSREILATQRQQIFAHTQIHACLLTNSARKFLKCVFVCIPLRGNINKHACFAKRHALDIDGIRNTRKMKNFMASRVEQFFLIKFFTTQSIYKVKEEQLANEIIKYVLVTPWVHVIFYHCIHLSNRVYDFHMLPHKSEKSGIAHIYIERGFLGSMLALRDVKRELLICCFSGLKRSFFTNELSFTCARFGYAK